MRPHFLDTQYRSHPLLADFVAEAIYGGRLRSGPQGPEERPRVRIEWGSVWGESLSSAAQDRQLSPDSVGEPSTEGCAENSQT